jgi:hypothetical protein
MNRDGTTLFEGNAIEWLINKVVVIRSPHLSKIDE